MIQTSNTSGEGESDLKRTATLNSLEVAKGIEVINNFVQTLSNSQDGSEVLEWLIGNPSALLTFLRDYSEIKRRCQDLEQNLSQAATIIGTKDTGATASSGHECYELVRQYQTIRGDFSSVSMQIFDLSHQSTSSLARNKKIAQIQCDLSTIILIDNYFLTDDFSRSKDYTGITKQIVSLIVKHSKIAELKQKWPLQHLSRESEDTLNELVKSKLQQSCINGLAILTKSSNQQLNYTEIIRLIEAWASKHLHLNIKASGHLSENIDKLVHKGIDFVMNLSNAVPPGRLWIEEKGVQFEQSRHQLHQMCGESQIEFTVFPGYSIDSIVLEKALVFTNSLDS